MRRYARALERRVRALSRSAALKARAALWPDPWASGELGWYAVWSWNPLILCVAQVHEPGRVQRMLAPLFETIGGDPARFLVWYTWVWEDPHQISLLREHEERDRRKYPNHHYLHLCNTERQLELFREAGLEAIFCNHNALKDERIYRPLPGVEREFDAVYDARLASFKRHDLALDVPRLALLYTRPRHNAEPAYAWRIGRKLRRAHHFNLVGTGTYRKLSAAEVVQCYARCHVGLCLSAEEGAMFASIQYLLCGLPVISTRSAGGRDVFFDDETTLIVDANPRAVWDGVAEMIARQLDPVSIRETTLAKLGEHRERLVAELQRVYREEGSDRDAAETWSEIFFNATGHHRQAHAEVIDRLEAMREEDRDSSKSPVVSERPSV